MSSSSRLPPLASDGVFCVSTSIVIDAPIDKVWSILTDFKSYQKWNAFVRNQTILDSQTYKPLASQALSEAGGQLMYIYPVHLPPTLGEPSLFQKQSTYVVSTVVDPLNHRVAWETTGRMPRFMLHAERWQMLTTTDGGKTKYESIEVFSGLVAYLVRLFVGRNLNLGVQAMAEGLKAQAELVEGGDGGAQGLS